MDNNGQLDFQLTVTTMELAVSAVDYTMRAIETFRVNRSDISYRAEGNANIVLALSHRNQVLRLPKSKRTNICRQNLIASTKHSPTYEKIFYVHQYIETISKLFGPLVSNRPIFAQIEFSNVDAFNVWLQHRRPSDRKNKLTGNDFQFNYGLLYPDAAVLNLNWGSDIVQTSTEFGDTFSVEIKPKQGWNITMVNKTLLQLFGIDVETANKCRFCSMQYLKIKEGKAIAAGKYCPLDLFSGDRARMITALRSLVESPQNNFRVFHNGLLIYADGNTKHNLELALNSIFKRDSVDSMDDFLALLVNAIVFDLAHNRNDHEECQSIQLSSHSSPLQSTLDHSKSSCLRIERNNLPKNSILWHILNLQLLTNSTISNVAENYLACSKSFDEVSANTEWPFSHVTQLCQKLAKYDLNDVNCEINHEHLKKTFNLSTEEMYEIGATALDCSIMLTFQCVGKTIGHNLSITRCPMVSINGSHFLVNASVFDLDPKLYPRHFVKYVERTRASYESYKQFLPK